MNKNSIKRLDDLKMDYDNSQTFNELITIDSLIENVDINYIKNYKYDMYQYDTIMECVQDLVGNDTLDYTDVNINEKRMYVALEYIKNDCNGEIPEDWHINELYSVGQIMENREFVEHNIKEFSNNLLIESIKDELKEKGITDISDEQFEKLKIVIEDSVDRIIDEPTFKVIFKESERISNKIEKEQKLERKEDKKNAIVIRKKGFDR